MKKQMSSVLSPEFYSSESVMLSPLLPEIGTRAEQDQLSDKWREILSDSKPNKPLICFVLIPPSYDFQYSLPG